MGGRGALALLESAILAVIVVQAAKLESEIGGVPDRAYDRFYLIRFDAGSVHARIEIEKNADGAANPLPQLFPFLDQNRNANAGKLRCDLPHPASVSSLHRIGDQDVSG